MPITWSWIVLATIAQTSTPTVSLEVVRAHAVQHAPTVRVSAARLRLAEAAQRGAAPWLRDNPTLSLRLGPRLDGTQDNATVELAVELSQALELSGARGARLDAADQLARSLEAEHAALVWSAEQDVTLAYHQAGLAGARVASEQTRVVFAREVVSIAERRRQAGEIAALEQNLAELDLAAAERDVLDAQRAAREAELTLAELSGWPLEAPLHVAAATLVTLEPVPTEAAVLATLDAVPELRAAQAARAEVEARRRTVAEREAWPTPVLGAAVAHEDAESWVVQGTLSLPLPLFQRGQEARTRVEVELSINDALLAGLATRLRAQLLRAHAALTAAHARLLLHTTREVPTLEATAALLRRGFEAGELPLLELTAARQRLLEARRAGLDAHEAYARARVGLDPRHGAWPPAAARGDGR
jgi:cobalt-zinc-cadmium efflux system outer membrane protein